MPDDIIDYSNTVFYKIYCKDATVNDIYVGHTTNFDKRKYAHRRSCIKETDSNHHLKVYKFIREHGGWVNWKINIIGFKDCADHYEARKIEQNYFETLHATLNSIEPLPKPKHKKENREKPVGKYMCKKCNYECCDNSDFEKHILTAKHKRFICTSCNHGCNKQSDFNKHLLTAKHQMMTNVMTTVDTTIAKIATAHDCICGKIYAHRQGLNRHKKTCSLSRGRCPPTTPSPRPLASPKAELYSNSIVIPENPEDQPSLMNIITQNKEIMDLLVLQNKEMILQNKEQTVIINEQYETIQKLIPNIGINNKV